MNKQVLSEWIVQNSPGKKWLRWEVNEDKVVLKWRRGYAEIHTVVKLQDIDPRDMPVRTMIEPKSYLTPDEALSLSQLFTEISGFSVRVNLLLKEESNIK